MSLIGRIVAKNQDPLIIFLLSEVPISAGESSSWVGASCGAQWPVYMRFYANVAGMPCVDSLIILMDERRSAGVQLGYDLREAKIETHNFAILAPSLYQGWRPATMESLTPWMAETIFPI